MKSILSYRKVSRERMIGFSLVDILIQALFVLFIALTIGYVDPEDREKTEIYERVGRDLCEKSYTQSTKKCVEDYLRAMDKFDKDNSQKITQKSGNLNACIPLSSISAEKSIIFSWASPDSIRFLNFTPAYYNYLNQTDVHKINVVKNLSENQVIDLSEIESKFGFVREKECWHDWNLRTDPNNNLKHSDVEKVRYTLFKTFRRLHE